jgi:hypothetical protein
MPPISTQRKAQLWLALAEHNNPQDVPVTSIALYIQEDKTGITRVSSAVDVNVKSRVWLRFWAMMTMKKAVTAQYDKNVIKRSRWRRLLSCAKTKNSEKTRTESSLVCSPSLPTVRFTPATPWGLSLRR